MKELLDKIGELHSDERRDLIIILSFKYKEDFRKANQFYFWPNTMREDASQLVRDYLDTKNEQTNS